MRIGSLFSGIGGLELGLEMAGVGRPIFQVEKSPFCRRILEKHWPEAVRHEDVRDVGKKNLPFVDVLCGGFPCQDVSAAGRREGLAGSRSSLWFEYLRIVEEVAPHHVVVENVASGARLWLPQVRGGLEALGYRTRALALSAADVGPHTSENVFSSLLPTPTSHNAKETGAPAELRRRSPMLGTMAVRGTLLLPTPTSSNYGSNRGGKEGRKGKVRYSLASLASKGLLTRKVAHPRGPLFPGFVEWMMGFPIGWTD